MAVKVELVYARPDAADAVSLSLPAGATVRDAVLASGMLERHPELGLAKQRFGIFGKRVPPDAPLSPGDRIEIYRPLAMDPKEARRRRAAKKR